MTPKILLVEDDTNLGFVISDHLKRCNYKVILCNDGAEGFKIFNEQTFHLCILDVMMPKKDGFTLAREIRKLNKEIPILFLTAKSMTESKIEGYKAGGDDYMTKPFSVEELELHVMALLKRVNINVAKEEENIFYIGNFSFDPINYKLIYKDDVKILTKKENQILKILINFKNQIVNRDLILNAIWGQDDYFVGRSLDVFITKLRKHFKEDPRISINNIHGIGFKLEITD
jgi:DNA-binding response OmpR family regulator